MTRILIIASGGGHTGFARAIAQYLPEKVDFVIPTNDPYSRQMISQYANKIYEIPKGREPDESSLVLFKRLFSIIVKSANIKKYDLIIATGSNHSIFPSFFQFLKGGKVYGIESQDRLITKGKAIGIISNYAKGVFLHWQEQRKLYEKKGIVVGPIVEKPKYESKDEGYILVTTGSMGFKRLFDAIVKSVIGKRIVIQTGKIDPTIYRNQNVTTFSFDPDLEKWIANASLVITHQGKTAMEAVVMYRKPVIMVYNNDWKSATTLSDAKKYAEILGATFLSDPITWSDYNVLLEAIENANEPNVFDTGTPNLVKHVLSEL
ncbi:UDP-N-acetylglucosamine--N-acetylmuramyl-(pentapeptide) pyrophosphoryl-undecaprenol N-acetylglucosamine transferase [Saccharolobus islandicus]|uniref:Oligosaccharide biosynthesis protein Alg14 like protein n=2 Tax=Saccharolobus islandicus TaxID=43080 RepID=C3MUC8_SACI4|nr:glycosyltransferase [Sulfolobus islandicus]ACP37162.1 Oligosaccharide biosynthesis protein Alg14 like protein [Sulfolobus islandicus M.14.25]ACP54301.1 Oligosaccharide biosynthesis protein Alg14 like protein [Sulfolobus islandicus M.16.27]PVU77652.1 polysaccharide biosynthesis protein [Sulfolobus islandicus]